MFTEWPSPALNVISRRQTKGHVSQADMEGISVKVFGSSFISFR